MKHDRFLLGILVFIGLLVAAALALFFTRQDTQTYVTDDTPEGAIHNYALALQNRDFQRAYAYLSEKENKPKYDTFRQAFLSHQLDLAGAALQVGQVEMMDNSEALVMVTVIHASSGPFAEQWDSTETAALVQQDGAWKIAYMPYPYWGWDWYQPTIEPSKP